MKDLLSFYKKKHAYEEWANKRILRSIMALQSNTEHESKARLIFSHIFRSYEVWEARIRNKSAPIGRLWDAYERNHLRDASRRILDQWSELLEPENSNSLQTIVRYEKSSGEVFENTRADILHHAFNHATYHRGQIARIIRTGSHDPPVTDYIVWARETS